MTFYKDHHIRKRLEKKEESLSRFAVQSANSQGSGRPEEPCPMRTYFQRDRDRILHTNAFRRLKHKTQVYITSTGDHYVTRLTHTLEVSQVARTISRALNLNEDLTEAISLGHDLGHTPFGHTGEEMLNKLYSKGFAHSSQSLRVVDRLENAGKGLNLTQEVRQGIVEHSKPRGDFIKESHVNNLTLEAQTLRIADAAAYLNHDVRDAIRAGILTSDDLPTEVVDILGKNILDRMIKDIVLSSWPTTGEGYSKNNPPIITMSEQVRQAVNVLREFMFERVYLPSNNGREGEKAREIVSLLYHHLCKNHQDIPEDYFRPDESAERAVVDYIAGMTDNFAVRMAERVQSGISRGVFQVFPQ